MNNEIIVPIVSILVITYNQENYIEQCIRSVLSQHTKYPFEIVVSDDHSSDQTPYILERLKNSNSDKLKYISNKQNVGIVKNYLNALNYCKGKYLCLLGGDDYWIDNDKIQKQVDFLEANSDYGLVYTDYNLLNQISGNVTEFYVRKSGNIPIEGNAAHLLYKGDSQIMSQTVCIRMLLLNSEYKIIMDDDSFLAEDFPTCFWISMYAKIHFMPENTAVYRIHNASYTNSHDKKRHWKFFRSHIFMRKKLMNYFNYRPNDWQEFSNEIDRILLRFSLKIGLGRNYGIVAYKSLLKNKKITFGDHIAFVGIKYKCLSLFARGMLLLSKKIQNK